MTLSGKRLAVSAPRTSEAQTPSRFNKLAISMAAKAASEPLLPAFRPARFNRHFASGPQLTEENNSVADSSLRSHLDSARMPC